MTFIPSWVVVFMTWSMMAALHEVVEAFIPSSLLPLVRALLLPRYLTTITSLRRKWTPVRVRLTLLTAVPSPSLRDLISFRLWLGKWIRLSDLLPSVGRPFVQAQLVHLSTPSQVKITDPLIFPLLMPRPYLAIMHDIRLVMVKRTASLN